MNRTLAAIAFAVFAGTQIHAQSIPGLPPPAPSPVSEIVHVQHQRAESIYKLIVPMIPSSASAAFDNQLKVITLNGPKDVVEMLMKNIGRLDIIPSNPPSRSIALTIHLIVGTQDSSGKLPDDLIGVSKQLHAVFPFKGYQLLDTTVMWTLEGQGAQTAGVIANAGEAEAATYTLLFTRSSIAPEASSNQITIGGFQFRSSFTLHDAGGTTRTGADLRTDVTLRDGQKIVIGKSSLGPGKESLFIVLSAKVAE